MEDCIEGQKYWLYFGFSFYVFLVLPCVVLYLEIFYFW